MKRMGEWLGSRNGAPNCPTIPANKTTAAGLRGSWLGVSLLALLFGDAVEVLVSAEKDGVADDGR